MTDDRTFASASFFDIEDEYFVKAELWLISSVAITLMDFYFDVAGDVASAGRSVIDFRPDFQNTIQRLAAENMDCALRFRRGQRRRTRNASKERPARRACAERSRGYSRGRPSRSGVAAVIRYLGPTRFTVATTNAVSLTPKPQATLPCAFPRICELVGPRRLDPHSGPPRATCRHERSVPARAQRNTRSRPPSRAPSRPRRQPDRND